MHKDICPTHYVINLDINVDNDDYNGTTIISIINNKKSQSIDINSSGLTIKRILCNNVNILYEQKDEILTLDLNNVNNMKNDMMIEIDFYGKIRNDMTGFYKSEYKVNKESKKMYSTQFEATWARKAFPCFDDPIYKATYDITLSHNSKYTSISNGKILNSKKIGNKIRNTFETTPKMSSYLVAFVIGEIEYRESEQDKRVRVYATKNNMDKLEFALDVATRGLKWYEKYFGIPYKMNKLDLIGIPEFSSGAMENWGLITFREEILYCTDYTNMDLKEQILVTIMHELAHQWFGNLVTMKSWNDLWLNESMATYFGWLSSDCLFPDWKLLDTFVLDEYSYGLKLDSLNSTHPIQNKISGESNIKSVFDSVTYSKGSMVVRYLANILKKNFRKGMSMYLKKYAFSNANADDLFDVFDEVNNNKSINIKHIMTQWITTEGYPLLIVNNGNEIVTISQVRYKCIDYDETPTHWPILLKAKCGDIETEININSGKHIVANKKAHDFVYNYDRTIFGRIFYQKIPKEIDLQIAPYLLEDYFAFALSGKIKYSSLFTILKGFLKNKLIYEDFRFWHIVHTYMTLYEEIYKESFSRNKKNNFAHIKKMLLDIIYENEVFKSIILSCNIENTSYGKVKLDLSLVNVLLLLEDTNFINCIFEIFNNNHNNPINIFNKVNHKLILKYVGKYCKDDDDNKNDNKNVYNKLVNMYRVCDSELDKETIIMGIGSAMMEKHITQNLQYLKENLMNISTDLPIKNQNIIRFMMLICSSKLGREMMNDFIIKEWNMIVKKYPKDTNENISVLKILGTTVYNENQKERSIKLLMDNYNSDDLTVKQAIETMNNNIIFSDIAKNDDYFKNINKHTNNIS